MEIYPLIKEIYPPYQGNISPLLRKYIPLSSKYIPLIKEIYPPYQGNISTLSRKYIPLYQGNISPLSRKYIPLIKEIYPPLSRKYILLIKEIYPPYQGNIFPYHEQTFENTGQSILPWSMRHRGITYDHEESTAIT